MIPIHIIQSVAKAAEGDVSGLMGTAAQKHKHGATPRVPAPRISHVGTAARIWLSALLGLALTGAIIAVNWGGVGIRLVKEEVSVRPGINDEWFGPNVAPMVARLESNEQELFAQRSQVASLLALKEGDDIVDVGAGSGFMSEEFSQRVGARGRVYAVEINPGLVEHIKNRVATHNLTNVRPHLGELKKLNLHRREGGNFDYVFIADTYHHFEYPQSMLRSIERLLRRRGQLIIVEPRKIPGQSPDAVLQHVRTSQAEVIREVSAAGFELVDEPLTPFLKDHYVLRFRKD